MQNKTPTILIIGGDSKLEHDTANIASNSLIAKSALEIQKHETELVMCPIDQVLVILDIARFEVINGQTNTPLRQYDLVLSKGYIQGC